MRKRNHRLEMERKLKMRDQPVVYPLRQNEFAGRIGIARAPVNPPAGMFARTWGSAKHSIADGLHRPLYMTALAISNADRTRPAFVVGIDLMAWMSKNDEEGIRAPLLEAARIGADELILHLSHSHGAPFTDPIRCREPGGDLIAPYREEIVATGRKVLSDAEKNMRNAVVSWATGSCKLAFNRDIVDPASGDILCGLNPSKPADDTLLVGRVTDESGKVMATLVNYACHPTSLGGGNRLISPDYVGAMREIVERETGGAICLFLHGADGELTPRRSFEDDASAADQNGREVGFAAMATFSALFPPKHEMKFAGLEESGAALGRWKLAPIEPDTTFALLTDTVRLTIRGMPSWMELQQAAASSVGYEHERLQRKQALREKIGDGDHYDLPIQVWRLGGAILVGAPVEFYSAFQRGLRTRFAEHTIAVLNICNGYLSYLPTREAYETEAYPVRVAVFESGSMEKALEKTAAMITAIID